MFSKGSKGDGICSLAAFSLAVNPSLRPNRTGHGFPPDCEKKKKTIVNTDSRVEVCYTYIVGEIYIAESAK